MPPNRCASPSLFSAEAAGTDKRSWRKRIYHFHSMVRDGLPFVLIPLGCAFLATAFGYWWLALPLILLAAFMAFFFRDPQRTVPGEANIVVAPADGRVTRVGPIVPAQPDSPNVVSIFLSPFDVHINRAPIAGEIIDVTHTRGRFLMATRAEASLVNEQNALTIRGERITVVCRQIAGILARRIVCWKRAGDHVSLGERFGLIKFSSRTDVVLPPEVELTVSVGERVRGGVSIIGRLRA
ncbi:MAG: phosphatidylserine decarboxylase family protein [Acidobacteria bacterium]|nr:MAG: phosphatidylserine decarboxylase family protein [Acidobacteriota bacterium]